MDIQPVDSSAIRWTTRDVWKAILSIPILWLFAGLLLPAFAYVLNTYTSIKITFGFIQTVSELLLLAPVWWFVIRKYDVPLATLGLRKSSLGVFRLGCGLMILVVIFEGLYNAIINYFHLHMSSDLGYMLGRTQSPWWYFIAVVIAAPLAEEIFFRGFIFAGFRQRYGWQKAACISSGLFGLFHLDLLFFIPTFLIGYIFAYLYQRSGSIRTSILLHFSNNAIAFLLAYLVAIQGKSG